MTANPKRPKPIRDKAYLKWIAAHECIITGERPCEAAHIRHGLYGAGRKPGDNFVLPLSPAMHRRQHNLGEGSFWHLNVPEWLLLEALKCYADKKYRAWKANKDRD